MGKPHKRSVKALASWANGDNRVYGRGKPLLNGSGADRLDDENDLVAVSQPIEHDLLIRFVRRYLKSFFVVGPPI
jgi:hypothetical protein